MTNIPKSLGKGSGWIIDSVIDYIISISKYNTLAGSSYIKLPKKLDHLRKGLINVQNTDDNEQTQEQTQKLIKISKRDLILKT